MSQAAKSASVEGVRILGEIKPEYERVLTPEAIEFVADLERKFGERRLELLAKRAERQKKFDAGELPDFLPETKEIRGAYSRRDQTGIRTRSDPRSD